jgi:hypothetical protein
MFEIENTKGIWNQRFVSDLKQSYKPKKPFASFGRKIIKEFLRRVCTEFQSSGNQQLNSKNEQYANACCSDHLNDKFKKAAEIEPFQENHISMMEEGKYKNINRVGSPSHRFGGRLPVIEFRRVFWSKNIDNKRANISDQYTGGGMESGCHHKIIQYNTSKKANEEQTHPGNRKWEPEYKEII